MTDIVGSVKNNEDVELNWCVNDDYSSMNFHYNHHVDWYDSVHSTNIDSCYNDNKINENTTWLNEDSENCYVQSDMLQTNFLKSTRTRTCSGSTTGSATFSSEWIDPSLIIINNHHAIYDHRSNTKLINGYRTSDSEENIDVVTVVDLPLGKSQDKVSSLDNFGDSKKVFLTDSHQKEYSKNVLKSNSNNEIFAYCETSKSFNQTNNLKSLTNCLCTSLQRDKGRDKVNHRTIERKRRFSLHLCFEKLKSELPFSVNQQQKSQNFINITHPSRISRLQVLTTAKNFIEKLNCEATSLIEKSKKEKNIYQNLLKRLTNLSSGDN